MEERWQRALWVSGFLGEAAHEASIEAFASAPRVADGDDRGWRQGRLRLVKPVLSVAAIRFL